MSEKRKKDFTVLLRIGNKQVITKDKYNFYYTLNDILLGSEYLAGSLCFVLGFKTIGSWIFLMGSCHLLLRPLFRIFYRVQIIHIKEGVTKQKK